jgi:hypothetical protein
MERSFARGTRYGFDRARWRGLWRVQIQEYLVATVQNIQVLLRYGDFLKRVTAARIYQDKANLVKGLISIPSRIGSLISGRIDQPLSSKFMNVQRFQTELFTRLKIVTTALGNSP